MSESVSVDGQVYIRVPKESDSCAGCAFDSEDGECLACPRIECVIYGEYFIFEEGGR